MDWSNERYVRLYTRDSVTWSLWPWESRALFALLLRKVDRAGLLDLGGHSAQDAVAAVVNVPRDVVERALVPLCRSGTVTVTDEALVIPEFIQAQEARSSDAQRQRDSRERRRAKAMETETGMETGADHPEISAATHEQEDTGKIDGDGDDLEIDADVTECDRLSPPVTRGHDSSPDVTPSLAEPSLAEPSQTKPKRPVKPPDQTSIEIAQNLYDGIKAYDPTFMDGVRPAKLESTLIGWARQIGVGIRNNGMTKDGCTLVIDSVYRGGANAWWAGKILSGTKLRKHYESLRMSAAKPTPNGHPPGTNAIGLPLDFNFDDHDSIESFLSGSTTTNREPRGNEP